MINPDTQPRTGASPPGFSFARRSPRNAPERTQAGGVIQIYLNTRKSPQRGAQRAQRAYYTRPRPHPQYSPGQPAQGSRHRQGKKQAPTGGKPAGLLWWSPWRAGFSDQSPFGVFLRPFCAFCVSAGISAITSAPSALSGRNALALSRYFCLRASMFGCSPSGF